MDKNWLSAFDPFIFDMDGLLVNSEDVYLLGRKRALDCKRSILDAFQDPALYEKLDAEREAFIYDSLENGDLRKEGNP